MASVSRFSATTAEEIETLKNASEYRNRSQEHLQQSGQKLESLTRSLKITTLERSTAELRREDREDYKPNIMY